MRKTPARLEIGSGNSAIVRRTLFKLHISVRKKLPPLIDHSPLGVIIRVGITQKGDPPMLKALIRFAKDESGATAIEYGLIAALVSVAAIGALGLMGDALVDIFTRVKDELENAAGS
jgi:pilus assembly protein Flp/PilA